jgi:hypothetical protein
MFGLDFPQNSVTAVSAFIKQLPWEPVGIVDVNLPFEVLLGEFQVYPTMTFYHEQLFNGSYLPSFEYVMMCQ